MTIRLPHGLGRIKSKFDERDYNLKDFLPKGAFLKLVNEKVWEYPPEHMALDQGNTAHCVGFSMANFGLNYPTHIDFTNDDGHKFYYQCKEIDGTPLNEDGSTIRSAAKVLQKSGRIQGYAFAPDMPTIKWWLLNRGPMIVGTAWMRDMFIPDANNILHITGDIVGGHAYLLNEWRIDNYIGIQNSWGNLWGKEGKAYISAEDFGKLFIYDGEAMTAVELDVYNQPSKECWLMDFFKRNKMMIKRN